MLTLSDRSVLVAGRTFNPAPPSGDRPMLLRYSAAGDLLWSNVEPTFARPSSLHRTSTGDVLLCGYDSIAGQWNVFIRRLNPRDGSTMWQTARPVSLGFGLFKPAVVEDVDTGSVLVAAALAGDALVIRLSLADGSLIDEDLFDGPRGGDDIATGIAPLPGGGFVVAATQGGMQEGYRTFAVDAGGNVIVGGFASASPGQDLAIVAFTDDGDGLFTRLDSAGLSGTESIGDLSLGQGAAAGTIGIAAEGFTPSQNQIIYIALYERDLPLGDLDGDGAVGPADLALVLSAWGPCGPACPADLDGDGAIGASDLGVLLSRWG